MPLGKRQIAQYLVSLGCFRVSLNPPFAYSSSLQGPIYCDNRKILSHPKERKIILDSMRQAIVAWGRDYDSIVGIATGGIPFGFALAQELNRPFLYVRSIAKAYGKKRCLEGDWRKGERSVLVEDLVNQGSALKWASRNLLENGLRPLACFSLVDYQTETAKKICREENLEHISLTNLDALLEAMGANLDKQGREAIERWRCDPNSWGW